jgi:hypothetical protein
VTEEKPKIPHPRLPRPDGDGWELDPDGDWWRWEPPPEGGWPKGPPIIFTRADLIARLRPNGEPPALAPRSSKSAKRTFIDFVPAEWTPAQEAFTRIIAVVGSSRVAVRDLRQDLRAGLLIGALRWCTSEDGWEACERLEPSVWQVVRVGARPWPDWTTIEIRANPEIFGHSLDWYISRASFEKRYSLLKETNPTPAPSTVPAQASLGLPPRKRGPANTHDWHTVDGKIMRRLFDADGRLVIPENESLVVKAILQDYADSDRDISETEVREAVRRVCAELRKGPLSLVKPGKKPSSR